VQAVVDCFKGQTPHHGGIRYRQDPGVVQKGQQIGSTANDDTAFRNADLTLSPKQLLANIQNVQRQQNLFVSPQLVSTKVCPINLDIEMETGTGKTYCYIKTLFELNKKYGWSKFIVVVPSIAIREGIYKSLSIMADHFLASYKKKARFFIYNSKQLHQLESFSSDAGINVMIINVQAFNATGKDNRRIYEELDDFQSRKPIDVISANRPILILDEPQKMEGGKTLDSLINFKPLMILRYSATHKTKHNTVHRLDALDAYNQKLVKKIEVRGISVKGLAGTHAFLFLESIELSSKKPPFARVQLEIKHSGGNIKTVLRQLNKGDNLFELSNQLSQYQGYVVTEINANTDTLTFSNGIVLSAGEAIGDVNEATLRRIQIREAIKAHFDKEKTLFSQGIKVLTLFFIDEVVKYCDYSTSDEKGDYARVFEEEYQSHLNEVLELDPTPYMQYLRNIEANQTHSGYFSIDKKSKRLTDPDVEKRGENAGLSNDVDAYDLILKNKERLLAFDEPVRFIFSHSALREGWDNPNVFVICTLKHSQNTISRRQEVGRGLRLCVNQQGDRVDYPSIVHQVNVLTVVASESYKDFVTGLQKDMSAALSNRPSVADMAYFKGKVLPTPTGNVTLTEEQAIKIEFYLIKNSYIDIKKRISDDYRQAKADNTLAALPEDLLPMTEQIIQLIDIVYTENSLPTPGNGRTPKNLVTNDNFNKQEFQALWKRINHKAAYTVHFDTAELVQKAIAALNDKNNGPRITPLQYTIQSGDQIDNLELSTMQNGEAFALKNTAVESNKLSVQSNVKYDLHYHTKCNT
jgi:type III restriction enzyme